MVQTGATSGTITVGTKSPFPPSARFDDTAALSPQARSILTPEQRPSNKGGGQIQDFALSGTHRLWLVADDTRTMTMAIGVNGSGTAIVTHYDRWY